MRAPPSTRLKVVLLFAAIFLLVLPLRMQAQEDSGETPLGDVARSLRKKPASSEAVIDNDNLSKVVDDAASRRVAGTSVVFSLDPGGKSFHVSSPDVTCSLSFSAKTTALLADPVVLDELPRSELAKLDGPATIDGDSLQVSMHNGTSWDLREIVIGLTIVRSPQPGESRSQPGQPRIFPAAAGDAAQSTADPYQKQPDMTMLLRVKGSAAPSATATFRTPLNFALFPDQEWHWAIVRAKGIAPQTPAEMPAGQDEQKGMSPSAATTEVSPQNPPSVAPPSNPDAAVAIH